RMRRWEGQRDYVFVIPQSCARKTRMFVPYRRRTAQQLFFGGEQACVATRGRRVDRDNLLSREAPQIVWPARLRSGAGEARPAERLSADDRADHVAVHIDIAVGEPVRDLGDPRIDARVDTECQPGAVIF